MTQHQNTELLPCPMTGMVPFIRKCRPNSDKPYYEIFISHRENAYQIRVVADTEDEVIRLWNTRPAKAVQGDKTVDELVMLIARLVHKSRNVPEMADLRAKTLDYLQRKNLTPSALRDESALTPESEGIAGEGDDLPIIDDIRNILKLEDAAIGKHTSSDECHALFAAWRKLDFPETLKFFRAALSTLARPQEIDVEALKFECTKNTADEGQIRTIFRVIDHLASSGYLSAPDGRAQTTKEQLNLAKDYSCQSREKELMAVIADLANGLEQLDVRANGKIANPLLLKYATIIAQSQAT